MVDECDGWLLEKMYIFLDVNAKMLLDVNAKMHRKASCILALSKNVSVVFIFAVEEGQCFYLQALCEGETGVPEDGLAHLTFKCSSIFLHARHFMESKHVSNPFKFFVFTFCIQN
jgi:hypothetical protein